jgi:diadenosine tetraphosphatase ApaH/serine/threonine PP2A family protein phosphatase
VRYLVLSDIHANIDALDAVLDAIGGAYDRVVVLGDLVGYGAEPNAVVDRVRELNPAAIIRGNHDKVAAGLAGAEGFNPTAIRAADWTRKALTPDSRDFLSRLPKGPLDVDGLFEICHGSPNDEDAYIFGEPDVAEALLAARLPLCLFGHTHVPAAASLDGERRVEVLFRGVHEEKRFALDRDRRYLVNPGSVGQPRDGDPRAAYAILDGETWHVLIARVGYPVDRARDRILSAGLPKSLGNRLTLGR